MFDSLITHIRHYISPSSEALHTLTSRLTEITVAKGRYLLQPGTYIKHEYFVIKGCLKAYYLDDKGHRHIIQFAIENWWVGDFDAFYNQVPSSLYIEAIEDAHLLAINYDDLEKVFDQAPVFERYFRKLVTGSFISLRKRLMFAMGKSTADHYQEFCKKYPNIEDRVPNYEIANYLGVSPENLSRVRRKLKTLKVS